MKYSDNVTFELEYITPQKAAEYLKFNASNRSIDNHTINRYAKDMAAGDWELNGETIVFYENGEVKDGQHRLMAIIKSGKSQLMPVIRGIHKNVTIHDRGRGRTTSNVLELAGYESALRNPSSVGAITFLYLVIAGERDVTYSMIRRFIDDYGDLIVKSLRASTFGAHHPMLKKSPIIAALFCAICCGIPYDVVMRFCECANTGFYNGDGETAAIVYRKMVDSYLNTGNYQARREMFYVALAAIEDFSKGIKRTRTYINVKESPMVARVRQMCFEDFNRIGG